MTDPAGQRDSPVPEQGVLEAVAVPWQGRDYICPSCERAIVSRQLVAFGKPPKYAAALNDILKCPWCGYVFSPKLPTVIRQ